MPLTVVLISGPRRGGKTTLVDLIGREVLDHAPHHIRLIPTSAPTGPRPDPPDSKSPRHVATSRSVEYSPHSAMDELTDALREVRTQERYATVLVEGDDVPSLRHAFPYDRRVFVMPAPAEFHAVFRRPAEAAAALRNVMQDTEGFAAEMFGLLFDETGARSPRAYTPLERQQRSDDAMASEDIRRFLRTPIGSEIASRIQLQPAYQGLVESDMVVINTALGGDGADVETCVHCIERLMSRVRPNGTHRNLLFCSNWLDGDDRQRPKLMRRLAEVCDDPL